jgi:hypothetical protein
MNDITSNQSDQSESVGILGTVAKLFRIVLLVVTLAAKPFASRKVRVAFATFGAAYAAAFGLELSEGLVYAIVGLGSALILGIAHEDNGRNAAGTPATRREQISRIIKLWQSLTAEARSINAKSQSQN